MTRVLSFNSFNSLLTFGRPRTRRLPLFALALLGTLSVFRPMKATADDSVAFATGGYARGLQSPEMKDKMDTNGDGMISRDEWTSFQEQVFKRLDTRGKGSITAWEFINNNGPLLETFATGGYARGLRTREMVRQVDTNHDHRISHDEFMTYQMRVFDLMDRSDDHKGFLSDENFFARIEANK